MSRSFDPVWEQKYAGGHAQRWPWDIVVSFVMRHAPRDRPRGQVLVLEVGCGTGANLYFAAREGFRVAGVDASPSAIAAARARFEAEGLRGDLQVADFTRLPFGDAVADLAFDRGALTCCGKGAARHAIRELARALKPGAPFLFNPYASDHGSRPTGREIDDGLVLDISGGTLVGAGQICFWSLDEVRAALEPGFRILRAEHMLLEPAGGAPEQRHAEWRVVAERA